MADVLFFEKPGCRNNTRQKALLIASGHRVDAHDIRHQPWTAETLRPYFGDKPVAQWINPAAPRVKAGEVRPEALDESEALALMVKDALLIRRPLMAVGQTKTCGFDRAAVSAWIGLIAQDPGDIETCPSQATDHRCPEAPGAA
ncbi:hypothetical protein CKO38_07630 [Rhodospirillum rubrum]|uniref:ArsC/Spx/MgsR family protein n=1 Tax=Rhodospirillum rubrum TaxID=1085 RepID=UPI00190327C8|nr:ArsC/Spx/MgsR family protein [Rhodospirillum rubrum]MBK1664700.1 hypothetical protein [Rhodospirillum rubrum]MBK1676544.1 hypothetical protein [Rhodospirillum rubrum]